MDAVYEGQATLDGRAVNVLRLTAADGYAAKLFVHASTRLPSMISWMAFRIS